MPELSFPLVDSSYDNEEILACIETLLGGQLTMGPKVRAFEEAFARYLGVPHAVMVNSGSSANLLALSALTNPARSRRLKPGDHVVVPAVCWSTSLWPVLQTQLKPVIVDVDPQTLNLSIPSLKAALKRYPIKGVMMVHILGNSTELPELMALIREHDLVMVEDTCESLGSRHEDRFLGALGAFGTFSFYFSHHMTTVEGGMVVAQTREDDDLLRALRAHGWSREQSNRAELEAKHSAIDPRFLFINAGYNLRPMELQAAFGLQQIGRLDTMNAHRRDNARRLRHAFQAHPRWAGQLLFPRATTGLEPCWFGFPFLIAPHLTLDYRALTARLLEAGIDTRPIVSGNMALQPALDLFDVDRTLGPFHGAQQVHERGLFIGCHAKPLAEDRVLALADTVLAAL